MSDSGLQVVGGGAKSGMIGIWHGLIANIPAGYVICDGNNSTPNYLDRFVKMVATAATEQGTTGGAAIHALSIAELAVHTHQGKTRINYMNAVTSDTGEDAWDSVNGSMRTTTLLGNTGSGSAHENNPLNYASIYVMKT